MFWVWKTSSVMRVTDKKNRMLKGFSDAVSQGSSRMLNSTIHKYGKESGVFLAPRIKSKRMARKNKINPMMPVLSQMIR